MIRPWRSVALLALLLVAASQAQQQRHGNEGGRRRLRQLQDKQQAVGPMSAVATGVFNRPP